jgi:hypothetical protein
MAAAQFATGIITLMNQNSYQTEVHDSMTKQMGIYSTDANADANTAWNKIQTEVK